MVDRRGLKLPKFKGKEVEAFRALYDDFKHTLRWTEPERKLHLQTACEDWIRPMFLDLEAGTTADDMMQMLISRFGKNWSVPDVTNALRKIERKPGEELHALADRVRSTAMKTQMPDVERRRVMRKTFFDALYTNSEMQHWVARYDDTVRPSMALTLDLALEWERAHGKASKTEKVRRITTQGAESREETETSDAETGTEQVNKIDYVKVKDLHSEDAKILAKQNNEIVSLLRKNAYSALGEDKSKPSRNSSTYSSSSYNPRSSSRRSSRDRRRSRSKERFKKKRFDRSKGRYEKKSGKYEKNKGKKEWKSDRKYKKYDKNKEKVNEVRDESPESNKSGTEENPTDSVSSTSSESE